MGNVMSDNGFKFAIASGVTAILALQIVEFLSNKSVPFELRVLLVLVAAIATSLNLLLLLRLSLMISFSSRYQAHKRIHRYQSIPSKKLN